MPRLAEGTADFELFDKYQRRRTDVDAAIGRLFLQGVSIEGSRSIAKEISRREVSAARVSKTASCLDAELKHYQPPQGRFLDSLTTNRDKEEKMTTISNSI